MSEIEKARKSDGQLGDGATTQRTRPAGDRWQRRPDERRAAGAVAAAVSNNESPWLQLLNILATLAYADPAKPLGELRTIWETYLTLSAADENAFAEFAAANRRVAGMYNGAERIRLALESKYGVPLSRMASM